jgi:hypothetical protein
MMRLTLQKDHPMTAMKSQRRMARPPYEPPASHEVGSEPSEQPMAQPAEKRVTKQSQVLDLLRSGSFNDRAEFLPTIFAAPMCWRSASN